MGNIISCLVHPANIADSTGARLVFKNLHENIYGMRAIFADGGYRGELIGYVKKKFGYTLIITPRIDDTKNKGVSPKRWIVERTIAWMESYRRLAKDYEYLLESSQAMLYLMSIKILLNNS